MSFLSRILQKETTPEVHNNQPGLIGLDLGSHTLHLCQLRPKSHRHYTIMAKASMGFEGSRQQLLDDPKAFKRLLVDGEQGLRSWFLRALSIAPGASVRNMDIQSSDPGSDLAMILDRLDEVTAELAPPAPPPADSEPEPGEGQQAAAMPAPPEADLPAGPAASVPDPAGPKPSGGDAGDAAAEEVAVVAEARITAEDIFIMYDRPFKQRTEPPPALVDPTRPATLFVVPSPKTSRGRAAASVRAHGPAQLRALMFAREGDSVAIGLAHEVLLQQQLRSMLKKKCRCSRSSLGGPCR